MTAKAGSLLDRLHRQRDLSTAFGFRKKENRA
jgi:hypothetical protein